MKKKTNIAKKKTKNKKTKQNQPNMNNPRQLESVNKGNFTGFRSH